MAAQPLRARRDGLRGRQRAVDPRHCRQNLGGADREHDLVEVREVVGSHRRPQAQLHPGEPVRVEVEQRAPAVAMWRRRRDGEPAADGVARVEQHDLTPAGQRDRTLEPGRSGPDDRHAPAAGPGAAARDERRGRAPRGAGWTQLRVDGAQQHRIERAAVLVAGDARPDVRRAPGEQLARHVRIGDQRARHADEVGARAQGGFDRVRRAERLRDQQRPPDRPPDAPDVIEQRRCLSRHVAHVRRAHPDRDVDVVHELADVREQLAEPVDGQARFLAAVGREPDADGHLGSGGTDLAHDPRDDAEPRVERSGAAPAVRRRRQELGEQVAVRGVQLDDLEARRGRVERRDAECLDDRVDLVGAERPRPRRLARRPYGRRGDRMEPLLGAGRLAPEVDQLARRHGALGTDGLGPGRHAGHRLGAPRLGRDPPAPGGLRRDHGAADGQHRRSAGRSPAPVLGVLGQRQAVLEDAAPVRGAHEPVGEREVGEVERLGGAHRLVQACGPRPPISAR